MILPIMARQCELCGKKPLTGYNVSHSKKRTKRRSLPNLQRVKVLVEGKMRKMRLCAQCIKSIRVKEKQDKDDHGENQQKK